MSVTYRIKKGIAAGAYSLTWLAILLSIFHVFLVSPPKSWAVSGGTTLTVVPVAPTGLTAADRPSDEGGAINLSWIPSTSSGVTEQRIYRGTTLGGPYPTLVTTILNNTTTTYTDTTGLTNGTTYYYVVRAFGGGQESGNSNEASAVPVDNIAPSAPTLLTAADVAGDGGGAINLSWTPSVSTDVVEQRVYRGTTLGGPYPTLVTTILNNTTGSYTDTGLTNGTTYYYVVRAWDGTQESANSNEASATPVNDAPFAPTALSAVDTPLDQGGSINLSWTPSTSGDVTQQRVYRATVTGGPYSLVTTFANNTTSSYTDSGLTNGTTYYYVVRAFDGISESADSNESSAAPVDNTAPVAPTLVSAADTPSDQGGSINLTWTPSTSTDVTQQRVYRSTTIGGPYSLVTTFLNNTTSSYTDSSLTNGTTYYYVVRAWDGTQESANSNEASAVPVDNTAPVAPTFLSALDVAGDGGGAINLTWTPSTSIDVTEQRVYRGTTLGGPYPTLVTTILNNTTGSYTDTGLTNGTTYYYVVRAYDGTQESANSNEASAIPVNNPPFAPTGFSAADTPSDQGGSINLTWTPSTSTDVTQQRVYRSTATGGPYSLATTILNNTTGTYTDSGLTNGTTYYYVVRAFDGISESADSNESSAAPVDNTAPVAPTLVSAADTPSDQGGSINLTWTPSTSTDVTQQRVYRSTATGGPYTLVTTFTNNATSAYTDTGLSNGTIYYYVIRAYDGTQESANSNEASAAPVDNIAPSSPTFLSATDVAGDGGGAVSLTWTPSVSTDVTEQRIYRSTTMGGPYNLVTTITNNTTSTYTDTGLINGTTYYYVVRSYDGTQESVNSNESSAVPVNNPPFVPTGLTAVDTPLDQGGSIDLNWTPSTSSDVTQQRLYRSTTMGGPYSPIVTITNNTTSSYTDSGLTNGTTYYYVIRAYDGIQESLNSNEGNAIPADNTAPAAPATLTAADVAGDGGGAVSLSWTPSVSGDVTQQRVYRSTTTGGPYTLVTTFTNNTTSAYTDTGLTNGTTYYYVVRAYDGTSESANSNEASATPANDAPFAPAVLSAIDTPSDQGGSVNLSWIPSVSGDVTQQRVYRSTTTGGPYSLVTTFTNNTTSTYTDTGLTNGSTYYYVVRAWDGVSESANSNEASATPLDNTAPSAPTLVSAVDTPGDQGGGINLSWTPSSSTDVTQQRVYRSTTTGGPYSLVTTFANNTTNTYTDTGLTNGTAYYYVVRAYDGTQESADSNEASATPVDNTAPVAPTLLTAADTPADNGGSINLSWTPSASTDVTQQRVYRSTTTGGPYSLVTTFTNNTTSTYTDTGLINGTTYYYVVRAYDGTQESANSNETSAIPVDNGAPAAPTFLSAADTPGDQGGSINLSWTPSVSGDVTQQRVYRSTITGGPYSLVTTFTDNTTSSYTDTGLTNGTTYYYVVRAWDGTQESANSNESSAIPADNTAPVAPTLVSAVDTPGDNGGSVDLTWTPSASGDVTQQRVYRSTTTGGPYSLVTTFTNNTTSTYTDTGLTNGTTYYYVVRTYDGTQESANSNEASAVPVDNPPGAPIGLSAVDTPGDQGGSVNLYWTPSVSTDVTQQRVYRSTITGGPYSLVTTFTNNTTSAYTDSGLTNGTTYYYVVRAYDGTQESANSNEASATPVDNTAPVAPTLLGAADTPSDNGGAINLSWTPSTSTDVTQQRVYRATTTGGPYSLVTTITNNTTNTYTDTGLTNGTTYYYIVRAYDGTQESSNSNEASAAPVDNGAPAAPTFLSATDTPSDNGGAINLSWTPSVSTDVTQQRVYRSTTTGGPYSLVATITNNTTSTYTDTGLTNGTAYYYVVRAYDGTQESANSNEASSTPVDNTAPSAPTALSAADRPSDDGGAINLSWTPSVSGDVTEQRVYRSTTTGGPYSLVTTFANNTTSSYTDTGLTNGTTYYYVVRAWDGVSESANSNEASAVPVDNIVPFAPTALSASDVAGDGGGAISLSWTPSISGDVVEQRIYRSTTTGGPYSLVTTFANNTIGTYTDTGLTNGTTYYYVVRAYDGTQESANSNETSATPVNNPPFVPTGLSAVDTPSDQGGSINLSWTPSASGDVTQQRIYRSTTTGGPYSPLTTINDNVTSNYTDTGLTNGTAYYYVIRAYDGIQESANSNEASATPVDNTAPATPTLLGAADVAGDGGGAVNLSWAPSTSGDVTQQRIYRATTTGGPYSLLTTFTNNTTSTYTDTGLTNGITYYYVIRAYDGTQESANSNEASATPANDAPFAPTGLSAADTPSDQGGSVNLSWTPSVSGDVTQQRVYRSTTTGGPYSLVTTFINNTTSAYTDTGLTNGTTYYYVVRAWDGVSESVNSNEASVTPLDNTAPSAPALVNAVDTPGDQGGSINLSWTPSVSGDVTQQRVYRSTTTGGPYSLVTTFTNNTTSIYTDTGLTNGTTYYYVVRAWDGVSESANSNEASVTPLDNTAPSAPTLVNAVDTPGDQGGSINLSWTPSVSGDVTQQRVYRSTTTGGPYSLITTITNNTTSTYTDTGLTNGTTYYYVVRAYDGAQESANSNEASAIPVDNGAPAAPTFLSALDTPGDQGGAINLSWTPSVSGDVTQQRVYRSTTTGGPYSLVTTFTNNTTISYTDSGLTNGTPYYYVVRAYDDTQESANSNEASATPVDNTAPVAPTFLSAVDTPGDNGGAVNLSWTPSTSTDVTQQRVYRATITGGPYSLVTTFTNNTTGSYTDTGLINGTTYYYVVRAYDGTSESANSNEANATPVDNPPGPPTGVSAADVPGDNGGAINLSWTVSASSDVTQQRIYRGTTLGGPYPTLVTTILNNTTNTYTDTGLTNGTTYYYVIRAYDGTQESSNSNEASAIPVDNTAPATPTFLSAIDTPGDNGGAINLSWTPSVSTDVTQQRIYRSTTTGGPYNLITTFTNNTTSAYTDTGLANGTTYYYIVRAYDGTQESSNSNEASATPVDNGAPAAPTFLSAADTPGDQGGSINLSWTLSVSGDVSQQRIYRSTATGGPYSLVATITNNTTSTYTDTGLTNGTTYYYVVRAYDGTQESVNSNEANAIPIDNTAPVAPSLVSAADVPSDQGGSVNLSWTPSASTDATQQRVYRATTTGGPYTLVTTFTNNTTSTYTDTGLTNGTTYYYVVRAYDGTQESINSNEASAAPVDNTAPATPTLLGASDVAGDGGGAVSLSWTPSVSGDVVEQRIYRSTTTGGPYSLVTTFANNTIGTYTDTGLTNGTTYYYVVRAYDGTQESANSNETSATPVNNPPFVPTGLSAVDTPSDQGGSINLSWTPSASGDVTQQRIYRSTTTGGPYSPLTTINDNVTSNYTDTGLTNGTAYYYVIRAYDGIQESANSNEASATPVDNTAPASPTLLGASDVAGDGGGAVSLSWTPSVSGDVTQQRVYRSTTTGGPYSLVTTFTNNTTSTYTDTGLTNGTTYYYVVRAYDGTSESANSNEASTTPANDAPFAPTGLSAADTPSDQGGSINLAWAPSASGDVTQQRVYRATTTGGPYSLVITFTNNTTSIYTDTGLTNGTTYYYVVRAWDGVSESVNSNEASVTPLDNTAPSVPTLVNAVDTPGDQGGSINLSWTPSASGDVTQQRVYRAIITGGPYSLVTTITNNTTSTYTDTGLTNGTTYYYVVRAWDGTSESGDSNEAFATSVDNTAPAAPTFLSAADTPSDNGGAINLSWTPSVSGDVTQQRVYRATTTGGPYSLVTTISNNTTSTYTDSGLINGTTYYYIVRAYDGAQESSNSNEASAVPVDNGAPAAPTFLSATDTPSDNGGAINLSWTPSVSGDVTQQRVYRATTTGGPYSLVTTFTNNTTGSYTDTGLINGTTYYYVVRAYDGTQESANSNEASATPVDNTAPVAPTFLSATDTPGDNGGAIDLSWTPSASGDVTQQRVYRSTTTGGPYSLVTTFTNNTTNTYTDTGLTNGTTYYYVVRAYDGTSESANSNEASAPPINDAPFTPTGLSAADTPSDQGGSIDLSWTPSASSDVTQQRVYRSTTTGGPYNLVTTFTNNTTSTYTDTGLVNGTTYYYIIRAFDGIQESVNSNEASATPVDNAAPAAPVTLSAADVAGDSGGAINLSWTPSVSTDVTQQRIYRATITGGPYSLVNSFANNTTSSYTDTGLTNGTTYYYVVRAWDGTQESSNSNEASVVPANDAPFAPTGLSAADTPGDQGGSINLTWTPSISGDVTQQRIYRATVSGGPYSLVTTFNDNITSSYTDTGLTNGTTYYYVVRAWDNFSESSNSNEASVIPVDNSAPVSPSFLSAVDTPSDQGGNINLTWTPSASTDVTTQRIYRSTVTGGPYTLVASITNNTTSSYTDTGLTNGTAYYYVVRAWDGTSESANSNEASATPVDNTVPVAPTLLNAADTPSDNGGSVGLTWTPSGSGDVVEQRVYRSTTTGGPYTLITTFANNTTSSYTETGLTNGATYYYVVRAYDATQESVNSNEASVVPVDNILPSAPTFLNASDVPGDNGGAIAISWTLSTSPDVSQQRIYRSTTIGGPYTLITTIFNNTTSAYTDTGLINGTTYYYVIRVYDGTYESANSNEASAIPADNTLPAAPTLLTGIDTPGDQGGSINLSWTPSTSTDVTQQRIYRSTTTGGPYNLVATLTNNTTNTYTDTGLTNGTTYYYAVRAYDGTQESANSNEASAVPLDNLAPAAPTALIATDVVNDSGGAIDLSWTPSTSTDVTQQRVYRSTATGGPYSLVTTFTNNTTNTYTDTGLTNGTTYYYVIRAFDGASESANSNEASVIPIGPPSAATSTIAAASPIYSDGISASTVTVTVRDASNNPVKGATVTLSSSRGALDTITQPLGTTNDSGQIIGSVASTSTGDAIITATVNGTVVLTQTATINFYNTQTGSNIVVTPSANTQVTFDVVITIGITSSTQSGTGTPLPPGYITPIYFDISTTAAYSGNITVCITYNEATYGVREGLVKILHNEGGLLVDRTSSINTATNTVCGVVTSFSEFVTASSTATNLQITTLPQTVTAGVVSNVVTVEAKDNNGVTDTGYSGTANVSSNSATLRLDTIPTGTFLGSTLSISITNGVGSFYFKDTTKGTPTITVTDAAAVLTATNQQETILADVPTGTITLTPSPSSIVADGISTSTVTSGVIRDVYGNSVEDGTLITVATDRGTITTADASGAYAGIQVATVNGVISFTVQSSTTAGTANVMAASVQGSASGSTQITFLPGSPAGTITLTPSPSSIVANGTTTSTVTSGVITDAYGNTVSNGTFITVATSLGTITTADADAGTLGIQVATSSGVISFVVQSGTVAGTADVTAASVQGSASGSTQITFLPGSPAGTITLTPSPSSIVANGTTTSTVTSGVITDAYGNTVSNGTFITVATSLGTITTADADAGTLGIQVATSSGVISFVVQSGTVAGTADVTAASVQGSASGSTQITFLPGPPAGTFTLTPNPLSIPADGTSTSTVTSGTIKDFYENTVLDGTLITVSTNKGTITTADADAGTLGIQVATSSGVITFTVRSDTTEGTATVSATSVQGSASGQATITFTNVPPELDYPTETGYGAGDALEPNSGIRSTVYTYKVIYRDVNNNTPSYMRICIDANPCTAMSADTGAIDPALRDGNYSNGEQYTYSINTLNSGSHTYYFETSDSLASTKLPSAGSLSGPQVNYPPALSYSAEAGYGTDGVDPDTGNTTVTFNFKVVYTDLDNQAPASIRACIDGGCYAMSVDTLTSATLQDGDYTNGEQYVYSALLSEGTHNYYFDTTDGLEAATLPSSGNLSGPIVTSTYTPVGTNVVVTPVPDVTITYTEVTASGDTYVTESQTGSSLPSGYLNGSPPAYFDIWTTATYTGKVRICYTYDDAQYFGIGYGGERGLRLLHYESGAFRDRTVTLDVNNNFVCGEVYSFSEFSASVEEATLVTLTSFRATGMDGKILLTWATASEMDSIGFNILRGVSPNGPFSRINDRLIRSKGTPTRGMTYTYEDIDVENGVTYHYRLENVDINGRIAAHMIASATPAAPSALTEEIEPSGVEETSPDGQAASSADVIPQELPDTTTSVGGFIYEEARPVVEGEPTAVPDDSQPAFTEDMALDEKGFEKETEKAVETGETIHAKIPEDSEARITEGEGVSEGFNLKIADDEGNEIEVRPLDGEEAIEGPFGVTVDERGDVILRWVAKGGVKGFNILRSEGKDKDFRKINTLPIPFFASQAGDSGLLYSFKNAGIVEDKSYIYRLETVLPDGTRRESNPIEVSTVKTSGK